MAHSDEATATCIKGKEVWETTTVALSPSLSWWSCFKFLRECWQLNGTQFQFIGPTSLGLGNFKGSGPQSLPCWSGIGCRHRPSLHGSTGISGVVSRKPTGKMCKGRSVILRQAKFGCEIMLCEKYRYSLTSIRHYDTSTSCRDSFRVILGE